MLVTAILSIWYWLSSCWNHPLDAQTGRSVRNCFFVQYPWFPFNTGTIFYFLLLIGVNRPGVSTIQKKQWKRSGIPSSLLFTFIVIGYSSFLVLVIRSNANTPLDENNPENAVSLLAYLNRDSMATGHCYPDNTTMLPSSTGLTGIRSISKDLKSKKICSYR